MKKRVGLGGNLYYWSQNKSELVDKCNEIGKSPGSIYYNKKYSTWVIRIKSKKHKI